MIGNVLLGQAGHYLASGLSDEIRVANDGLAALVLLGVTVRSGTPWMGVVMLFYAAQFSLHAYYLMMERSGGDYVHALINNLNFIGVNLCLVIGTLVAWRGRRVRARAAPATERRFIPR